MTAWILAITGVTVLSVLVDLILPNGQTSKYIKNVFAFIMIFVIISPLPSIINGKFTIDNILSTEEITIQEDFIYQVNKDKLLALEKNITQILEEKGLKNVIVTINADIFEIDMQLKSVNVDLSDLVIDENYTHIDIKKTVTDVVNQIVGEQVVVIFNE